jgi:hypothetical protein
MVAEECSLRGLATHFAKIQHKHHMADIVERCVVVNCQDVEFAGYGMDKILHCFPDCMCKT